VTQSLKGPGRRLRARHGGAPTAGPPPEPARPAGTDLLPQIKHIVVLMMENHSYDNYLGMLPACTASRCPRTT